MSIINPGKTAVQLHEFVWIRLLKGYYRRFVHNLNLNEEKNILDFGCGPGAVSRFIATILAQKGGNLICFDISKTWIERAKKHLSRFPNVRCICGDILLRPLNGVSFDTVVIHFVLHDIERQKRDAVAKELAALTKPGGRIIIREPSTKSHGMPPEEIRSLFSRFGFTETGSKSGRLIMMGDFYTGVFLKQGDG